ncbi:MAG: hypothetical protein Q8J76_06825 [Desulfobulbaceae bacterium]|nr:hypothetical protein [Desulfobulbaceae bacterium]
MNSIKRKRHFFPEFKAKVALEAILKSIGCQKHGSSLFEFKRAQ